MECKAAVIEQVTSEDRLGAGEGVRQVAVWGRAFPEARWQESQVCWRW